MRLPPERRVERTRLFKTSSPETGAARIGVTLALSSLVLAGTLSWIALREPSVEHARELTVYCAAGIMPAVQPVADAYEEEFGVKIRLDSASSGALLNKIKLQPKGDLYIPADELFVRAAREASLIREVLPLARFRLCLAVAKENPKNVRSLQDVLANPEVTLALPNERAAAGAKAIEALRPLGLWEPVMRKCKVQKPTVTEVAQDLVLGTIDAALVWDSTARQRGLAVIELPEFENAEGGIVATVLASSKQPADALRFARYLAAPTKGQPFFARQHYVPVNGDAWAETPRILLFSGGVNRPAVEATIKEFEAREGVIVHTDYKGCGALIAQMEAGSLPDVYFACDVSFSHQVETIFEPFTDVSRMRMILLVPKGNPKGIRGLEDLARSGLKIGRADEVLSALGALTAKLLKENGLYDAVARNTAVTAPTAAELVSQVVLGSHLDAAVVYEANAFASLQNGEAELVPIAHENAVAVQPIAARKETPYPNLTERLLAAIQSDESRGRFERVGFAWLSGAGTE